MSDFNHLPSEIRFQIEARSLPWTFRAGELLIEQGAKQDSLIIVLDGCIRVSTSSAKGDTHLITKLGHGGIVGEMSLLLGLARTAQVYAHSNSNTILLSRADYIEIKTVFPKIECSLAEILFRRLTHTHENLFLRKRYAELVEEAVWREKQSSFSFQFAAALRAALRGK